MNLFVKSVAVLSAVLLLSACDTDPNSTAGAEGKGGAAGSAANMGEAGGYLDAEKNVADRVFFEFDSSAISGEAQQTLETQATWLKGNPSVSVTVEGHCDERGTREYNIALGERRATAAKKVLVSLGVQSSSISTISYGKERPAVLGSNEEAWAQNRRSVTIVACK